MKPSTGYEFFIVASNSSGKATSNTVKATTLSLLRAPSTPELTITITSTNIIGLKWTPSKNASSIELYEASSASFKRIAILNSNATSYVAENLKPLTNYSFFVVSINPAGRATSNVVSAKTNGLPPLKPYLKILNVSTNTVKLKWSTENASFVYIYEATTESFFKVKTLAGKIDSYTVTNLKSDTYYKFIVAASNAWGSATSNIVAATTLKIVVKPVAPEVSANSPNAYSVVLTWTEVSTNVSGFHIWRRSSSNKAYTLIATVSGSSSSYTDIVNPGHTYSYMVSAYNSAGQSFSKSKSIFVGQDYFPMKTSNSLVNVDAQPSTVQSQSIKSGGSNFVLLSNFIKRITTNNLPNMLIPINEVISYQKFISNDSTIYTVDIPCAFSGEPNVDLKFSFQLKNSKVYLQNFAPFPILVLNNVYGEKPSSSQVDIGSYKRSITYISAMAFGTHIYKNVLKVTLKSSSMEITFYFVPQEGLMKFEILVNGSTAFSYTTISTSTKISQVYPQPPIITNPSNNSTVPSTFTLEFTGNSSTYTIYLNSQTLSSISSTVVKIGPLTDGDYDLAVKAKNSCGLETLSNVVNFTVKDGWIATPTYVVGDFTNWATNSNYKMTYDAKKKIYILHANIPTPSSTSIYGTNRYMIEQMYKGKIKKYGYQPIPVKSGNVTFYFNPSLAKPFTSAGIGDSSKESMKWYLTGKFNDWEFATMTYIGNGIFVATATTTGIFEPGTYDFKITPQSAFSTSPASLISYYFNGSYNAYYLANGKITIATPSNIIIVEFNVLDSTLSFEATNETSVYLRSSFGSWFTNLSRYKFKYDPFTHVYSLTLDVPEGQQQYYKVFSNGKWYGGKNIPIASTKTIIYFYPALASTTNAIGIGDTSKESMRWYYRGALNDWHPATMTYIGNGTFAATFTGNFSAGDYPFKIAPNTNWSSSPYYYNGVVWGDTSKIGNGNLHLNVSASKVVVKFNVLKSLVTIQPVISPTYYVAGNFDGWQNVVGNSDYKMTEDASGIYTLTTTLPSTTGQWQYKIIDWTGTRIIWYGGNNIPVKAGTVTFYFDPNNNGGNSSAFGIGDTTKETMKWYFTGGINNWKFATMTYIGNGTFAATLTRPSTNDYAGAYGYKITPQPVWSTTPASLTQYYFNGGYGAYRESNGTVIVPQSTTVVVDFNVLDSSVSIRAVKVQKLHQVIKAFLDSMNEIHATLNFPVDTSDLSQFSFTVDGQDIPISSVVDANTGTAGVSDYITIKLAKNLSPSDVASSMILTIDSFSPATVYARYALNNSAFHYDGQLGAIYTSYQTTFKVWSPVSNRVILLLFKGANDITPYATYAMTRDSQGVWSVSVMGNLNGVYYDYSYHRYGQWVTAPDIYSKAANADNTKSMVVALSQTNPSGWNSDTAPFPDNMVDAIIYELHVQDFTDNPNSGVSPQYQGTYMGFTQTGTTYDGVPTGIDHLAQLGVNYVQLLPIEDYEDPQNPGYNWGYVPYLYMVPEAKYSTTPNDPQNTIEEVKRMIESLHSKGMGVILDISFSHTSYITIPYTAAVPYYYYNYNEYGQKTNYSGVGNDLKTSNYMVRKLIIDTLEYWMEEYHVSGFRFDQMYLYDPQTIQDIVQSLREINSKVLLYGEPWPAPGYEFTYYDQRGMHLGLFNGYFRDAIIGTAGDLSAEGFVNGNPWNDDIQNSVKAGIVGSVPYNDLPNTFASNPDETINYVTCHDNYTLWDKITGAKPTWSSTDDISAQKLAGAMVLLSQGVPFLQGGIEFARTKDGNGNSYNVQGPNEFDWSRLTEFASVDDYYQGLIMLRKAHPAFRMISSQEINDCISFLEDLPSGVIGYKINGNSAGDSWSNIVVYFNGNATPKIVTLPSGTWNMAVNGKTASTTSLATVSGTLQLSPLSAYVLYK